MGRIRKTLAWTFSPGGSMKGPIRAESSAERAAREHAELLREQNRLLAEQNRLTAQAARPARARGGAQCVACGQPIEAVPAGSGVPFVHTDTGEYSC
jgi:hypothetical protein